MANTTGKKFGGRSAGVPNRTTAQSKDIVQKVIKAELNNLETLLSKLSAKDRINALIKLLPFVIPKQQEISIDAPTQHTFQPITITVKEPLKINEPNEKN